MTEQEMIEALADAEHASWARWMAHLFSRARSGPGFTKHISYDDVTRWQRQIDTPYADLTEREKQSDRDEVAHILPIINARIAALEGERDRLLGWQAGQPHYIGCWRAHRKCAIDTVEFEVARRERAEAERDAAQALSAMTARKLTEQLDHAETLASRLAAAEAALEAENKALREFVLDAIDCLERLDGPRRPNTLGWSEEVRLALHALCKPLAASGGGEG